MKIIQTIPEEEMVLEFVNAELKSPRFSVRYLTWLAQHGNSPHVNIETLDARVRKDLLVSVRPGLFKTLPHDMVWHDVLLESNDWAKMHYINNDDDWKNFSSGSRLVGHGVEKLGQPEHGGITQRVAEITQELLAGKQLPRIILVASPDLEKLVLLEGHVRATAYMSSGIYREKQVSAILGISESIVNWYWY